MSPTVVWLTIAGAALTTLVSKAVGPALTGARALSPAAVRVVVLLAPALLAALVVTNALADGRDVGLGADTAGAAVAVLLLWRRVHLLVVVVAAAAVTAGLRAAGVG